LGTGRWCLAGASAGSAALWTWWGPPAGPCWAIGRGHRRAVLGASGGMDVGRAVLVALERCGRGPAVLMAFRAVRMWAGLCWRL
jgi:hypothetical protein